MRKVKWCIVLVLICLCCACVSAAAPQRATPIDLGADFVTMTISPTTFVYNGRSQIPNVTVYVDDEVIGSFNYEVICLDENGKRGSTNVGTIEVRVHA